MSEKELSFICAYTDCSKETTVIVKLPKSIPTKNKSMAKVYYCEHCNSANKVLLPDNPDVHRFILGSDKGFLRYTGDGILLLQREREL
jgi:hypothetical protein